MANSTKAMIIYKLYKTLTYALSPFLHLHLHYRKLRGFEHPTQWPQRLGHVSLVRPPGPLIWFHAVSLGEGMSVIPVIKRCVLERPEFNVLLTTTTVSAFEVIKNKLPSSVLYQFSPIDTPGAVEAFLSHWKPDRIVIMESELWPNLIIESSRKNISLALLNARMSEKSFRVWSRPMLLPLASLMLSKFSLIVPLSTLQAIHFQLLEAPPFVINFSGDLKYAVEHDSCDGGMGIIEELKAQLAHRKVWMASSIHRGEEEIILGVHQLLIQMFPDLLTIIVPRHPRHGQEIAQGLEKTGQSVALRSRKQKIVPGVNIYVVDTLGELRLFYSLTPIAVVGGSFFPGLKGHNLAEAAAAGCAVLTGYHIGHFAQMVREMKQLNFLSVLQVSGNLELAEAIKELFCDSKILESRRMAAKQAYLSISSGIIDKVYNLGCSLKFDILRKLNISTHTDLVANSLGKTEISQD